MINKRAKLRWQCLLVYNKKCYSLGKTKMLNINAYLIFFLINLIKNYSLKKKLKWELYWSNLMF